MTDVSLATRRFADAIKALRSLKSGGFLARLAGGCVRDRLLGLEPKDYDVATSATPEEVVRHFKSVGWRTVPTGVEHGTVTLVLPSGPVEITTLRIDVATDGRHAHVAFGKSFEEDAARRDFTVNAMYEDENGVVYDYHGGQDDLARRALRFVGDPAARIREDYLRILRLFRFWSSLGFAPEAETLAATKAEATGLKRISQERITSELVKLCAGDHAASAMGGLRETGILGVILPEAGGAQAGLLGDNYWQALRAVAAPRRGLVGLIGALVAGGVTEGKSMQATGLRLKMSTADTRIMAATPEFLRSLGAPVGELADAMAIVDELDMAAGAYALPRIFLPLARALGAVKFLPSDALKVAEELALTEERLGARRRAKLPLDGNQLASALAIAPGKLLGDALERMKRGYRNGAFETAADAIAWLKKNAP